MSNFKKNQKVKLSVRVGGIVTSSNAKVLKVNKEGVWLDNGVGNDPSGPFDPITGERPMFIGSQKIEAI